MRHFVVNFIHHFVKTFHSRETDFEIRGSLDIGQDEGIDVHGLDVSPLWKRVPSFLERRITTSDCGIVVFVIQIVIVPLIIHFTIWK